MTVQRIASRHSASSRHPASAVLSFPCAPVPVSPLDRSDEGSWLKLLQHETRESSSTWIALGHVGALVLALAPSTRGQGSGVQVFTAATLIDGTGGHMDGAELTIRSGQVVSAGRSGGSRFRQEAGSYAPGKFLIPGLISARPRLGCAGAGAARLYAGTRRQLGVSTLRVTTVLESRRRTAPGLRGARRAGPATLDRSRIYVSGEVVTGKTPEQARQMVASVAEGKPDIIKMVDDNLGTSTKMTPEVYRAVIEKPTAAASASPRTSSISRRQGPAACRCRHDRAQRSRQGPG